LADGDCHAGTAPDALEEHDQNPVPDSRWVRLCVCVYVWDCELCFLSY
jgi:hypothetical protein